MIPRGGKADVSNLARKYIDSTEHRLMELQKSWDHKLVFPLSELGKRYLRRDCGILLDCFASQGEFGNGKVFSLAVVLDCEGGINTHA